jgi:hypothetical protein
MPKNIGAFGHLFLIVLGVAADCGNLSAEKLVYCDSGPEKSCKLSYFDRTLNRLDDLVVDGRPETKTENVKTTENRQMILKQVWAINSVASKTLFSGTIISYFYPELTSECEQQDWKLTVLSNESSNVLIYGPADISQFCDVTDDGQKRVVFVLPVYVIWVEIFKYDGEKNDALRKEAGAIAAPHFYCGDPVGEHKDGKVTKPKKEGDLPHPTWEGIHPCSKVSPIGWIYNPTFGKLYNRLTQTGTSQGTVSFTPAIGQVPKGSLALKPPNESLNFDVQLYPSGILGYGWLGFPVVFEKANTATANLNSLTMALSYDIPFSKGNPYFYNSEPGDWAHRTRLLIRPPDVRVQYGPEIGASTPHDVNLVATASVRVPFVLDIHRQPSALTLFPVLAIEVGNAIRTHLPGEGYIFRKVVGFDSSFRFPFVVTHALLGDKPTTIDFSWRTRYLSYREPLTDYVSGNPEVLTKQQRNYWRGSYVVPISTLVQFKVTVQHGGLPPSFNYLGYTLNLGLTFGNPGFSEH